MRYLKTLATVIALVASPVIAQTPPIGPGSGGIGGGGGGSGGSYIAGSGLTLGTGCPSGTPTTFCLQDGTTLTYSAGALATTSLALGGATLGTNKLVVNGNVAVLGGSTNTGTGSVFSSAYNAANNKQMLIGDTDYLSTSGKVFLRVVSISGSTYLSSVSAVTNTEVPVSIGNSGISLNVNAAFITTDGAAVLADRNGGNAQAFRVAYSFTGASDYSWAAIVAGQTGGSESCAANTLCLGSWHVGTPGGGGSLTKLKIYADGTSVADYNSTTAGAWAFSGGASCTLTVVTHLTVVNGIVTLCN